MDCIGKARIDTEAPFVSPNSVEPEVEQWGIEAGHEEGLIEQLAVDNVKTLMNVKDDPRQGISSESSGV